MSDSICVDIPSEAPTSKQVAGYWSAFAATAALVVLSVLWWLYSPNQDHLGAIPLNGDGRWFHNYEIAGEIQDQEIFFDGIGHSIENSQQADIIFLGASTVLFGIDWRLFEAFEQKHHVKMFNMAFAGIGSGAFSLRLAQKWNLHPKLWIIDVDMYQGDFKNSFFYMILARGGSFKAAGDAVRTGWLRAYLNVLGRNIGWRLKMARGGLQHDSYRSAVTGNWFLDNWPNQMLDNNAAITPWSGPNCPENPEEVVGAKKFFGEIGGDDILIQVPSVIACAQRVQELGTALGVPARRCETVHLRRWRRASRPQEFHRILDDVLCLARAAAGVSEAVCRKRGRHGGIRALSTQTRWPRRRRGTSDDQSLLTGRYRSY